MTFKGKLKLGFIALTGAVTLGLAIAAVDSNGGFTAFNRADADVYSLTLNSSNKVTSAGQVIQHTATGNDMPFTYTNVKSSTSGHVSLNATGTLMNDNMFRSITKLTVNFTAEENLALKMQLGYTKTDLNTPTYVSTGYEYNLSSKPYFIKFTAEKAVTINSITFTYDCTEHNQANITHQTEGESYYQKVTSNTDLTNGTYLIVHEGSTSGAILNGASSSVSSAGNDIQDISISSDYKITSTTQIDNASFTYNATNKSFKNKNNEYLNGGKKTISFSSSEINHNTVSISSGNATIIVSGTYTLRYNTTWTGFRYYDGTSVDPIQLYKKYTTQGKTEYDTPAALSNTVVGFTATDNNKDNYDETSVYSSTNGLVVTEVLSNGQAGNTISYGANGYSYEIRDSLNQVVNASQAFGTEGEYRVTVSYGNFIPSVIEFTVGPHLVVEGLTNHFSYSETINTTMKLNDFIGNSGVLSTDIEYNHDTYNTNVSYANYGSNGLTMTLQNPSGVDHAANAAFGTAGTWTITVSDGVNEAKSTFTVVALPVSNITMNNTELALNVGDNAQLTATTNANAHNQGITWASDNACVTVTQTGYLTANSAGTAHITATAQDNSGVQGSCTVTVSEAPEAPAWEGDYMPYTSSGAPAKGSYVIFTSGTSGSVYAMSKTAASSSPRDGITSSVTSNKITLTSTSSFGAFEVKDGLTNGTVSFYDVNNEQYLRPYGSSNGISLESALSNYSSWSVTGSTEKSITAVSGSKNLLKINDSTHKFSCYGSTSNGVSNVCIFYKEGQQTYPTSGNTTMSGVSTFNVGDGTTTYSLNYGSGVTVKQATWTSSNTEVATIDSSTGILTPLAYGTTTIKARVKSGPNNDNYFELTKSVTITAYSVTLNHSQLNLTVGGSDGLLSATVYGQNGQQSANQSVTWVSSNTSVATVNGGTVVAVAAGSATITVTSEDGNRTATCAVTVTASSGGGGSGGGVTDTLTREDTGVSNGSSTYTKWSGVAGTSGAVYAGCSAGGNDSIQLRVKNSEEGIVTTASGGDIYSITVAWNSATSERVLDIYGKSSPYSSAADLFSSNSSTQGTFIGSIDSDSETTWTISGNTQYQYVGVRCHASAMYIDSISFQWGEPEPINPEGISLPSTFELGLGSTKTLTVTYSSTQGVVNQNMGVTWGTSNENVVSINPTTGAMTGIAEGTATITATSTYNSNLTASCTVTVSEQAMDEWTIMIYMCGADLESGEEYDDDDNFIGYSGNASADITEILNVVNVDHVTKPDDVNIIIETGGANIWADHDINKDYLQKWHVDGGDLVNDGKDIKVKNDDSHGMGETATFQEFLEWGLTDYPAQKTGVIMWNHGGALRGCCYDEKHDDESLTSNEVKTALHNAFETVGRSESDKLEFIGYDCCLMQVQDIAEFNSHYFNYMVASEESEAGSGWAYQTWVDDLYAKKSTTTILKAIVDGFIASTNKEYSDNGWGDSDQTLSYLDLSYMPAYYEAFEIFASDAYDLIEAYTQSSFITLAKTVKEYGTSYYHPSWYASYGYSSQSAFLNYLNNTLHCEVVGSYYYDYGYYYYGIFDVIDFLNKMNSKSAFSTLGTQISNLKNNLLINHLIAYSKKGSGAGNSNGLCLFFPIKNTAASFSCEKGTYYSDSMTAFSNWKKIVDTYGG